MNASIPSTSHTTSHKGLVIAFAAVFILLLALLFWPMTKQLIPMLADAPSVHPLGSVQRSSFIGGFATRTQVETTAQTILLYGAIEIGNGTSVERRVTTISNQLCVVGSNTCHEIASR